jgi:hypothetical protein
LASLIIAQHERKLKEKVFESISFQFSFIFSSAIKKRDVLYISSYIIGKIKENPGNSEETSVSECVIKKNRYVSSFIIHFPKKTHNKFLFSNHFKIENTFKKQQTLVGSMV